MTDQLRLKTAIFYFYKLFSLIYFEQCWCRTGRISLITPRVISFRAGELGTSAKVWRSLISIYAQPFCVVKMWIKTRTAIVFVSVTTMEALISEMLKQHQNSAIRLWCKFWTLHFFSSTSIDLNPRLIWPTIRTRTSSKHHHGHWPFQFRSRGMSHIYCSMSLVHP